MKTNQTKLFYTPKEAAQILNITRRQVYTLIYENFIPACKIGQAVRIPITQIQSYKEKRIASDIPFNLNTAPCLLGIKDIQSILTVSYFTIYRLIKNKKLNAFIAPNETCYTIRKKDLIQYLNKTLAENDA
ncbi:helix-turn-helix domain-containing protein [Treponema putidum]|uniref:DNA-binding protein n=1 Tax=Treponema putidum TaxID=221027 RepID=A0ABY5HWM5_9SPIR|nr:helix-turn-helix domain-containing protein [Treponema putidum]UTY29799.1 DNA-binding protein [Treponema putidum]